MSQGASSNSLLSLAPWVSSEVRLCAVCVSLLLLVVGVPVLSGLLLLTVLRRVVGAVVRWSGLWFNSLGVQHVEWFDIGVRESAVVLALVDFDQQGSRINDLPFGWSPKPIRLRFFGIQRADFVVCSQFEPKDTIHFVKHFRSIRRRWGNARWFPQVFVNST